MHTMWTSVNVCICFGVCVKITTWRAGIIAWTPLHVAVSCPCTRLPAAANPFEWRAVCADADAAVVGRQAVHQRRRQYQDDNCNLWDDYKCKCPMTSSLRHTCISACSVYDAENCWTKAFWTKLILLILSVSDFPLSAPTTSSVSVDSPLLPSITPSLFHCRLKTYLFHKSFPP